MRLLARYGSADELATDVRDQLPRGGMVVRTQVPAGLQLFSPVEVAVECGGKAIVVAGQVLQIFPGIGVAVGLDRPARDRINTLVDPSAATGLGSEEPLDLPTATGTSPLRTITGGAGRTITGSTPRTITGSVPPRAVGDAVAARTATGSPGASDIEGATRVARGTVGLGSGAIAVAMDEPPAPARRELTAGSRPTIDCIQLALHGDRDQRMEILRGRNRALHAYVLRNPALSVDEIATIARMTTVSPEVLVQIAERREWGHRPEVAASLIRNPTMPVPVAIKLLDHVADHELRNLAKDARTREPIQRAARRKLLS